MLAPRKKLWSSPKEVIDAAIALLELTDEDICCDIGCGDGRFLFRACELTAVSQVIGIEVDDVRCEKLAQQAQTVPELSSRCNIICGNALDQDFSRVTCFFLYLIPHGLRVIYRHVLRNIVNRRVRVVTYMSPLPSEFVDPVQIIKVPTSGHTDAEWPLYLYEIYNKSVPESTDDVSSIAEAAV